jgi:hypothetical protein
MVEIIIEHKQSLPGPPQELTYDDILHKMGMCMKNGVLCMEREPSPKAPIPPRPQVAHKVVPRPVAPRVITPQVVNKVTSRPIMDRSKIPIIYSGPLHAAYIAARARHMGSNNVSFRIANR